MGKASQNKKRSACYLPYEVTLHCLFAVVLYICQPNYSTKDKSKWRIGRLTKSYLNSGISDDFPGQLQYVTHSSRTSAFPFLSIPVPRACSSLPLWLVIIPHPFRFLSMLTTKCNYDMIILLLVAHCDCIKVHTGMPWKNRLLKMEANCTCIDSKIKFLPR